MEPNIAQRVYTELNTIKEARWKVQQDVERLTVLVVADSRGLQLADYMAIVELGASGMKNISEEHDRYIGEAIAHEHLR